MHIIETPKELQSLLSVEKPKHRSIGFVPTMGALHEGHLSLIAHAKRQNDFVIVSVFVNPKQFGEGEDFDRYPRPKDKDIELCQKAGVDVLFMPSIESLYIASDPFTLKAPKRKSSVLEGKLRPGHFDGVVEVVIRLLNLSQATRAYFGRKDAQQVLIIKQMVRDLFMNVEIIDCPIQRDSHGLALSSRNAYLSEAGYRQALNIPRTLEEIKQLIAVGECRSSVIIQRTLELLKGCEVDYVAVVNYDLEDVEQIIKDETLILLVVRVEGVRLLDNLWV